MLSSFMLCCFEIRLTSSLSSFGSEDGWPWLEEKKLWAGRWTRNLLEYFNRKKKRVAENVFERPNFCSLSGLKI